VSDEVASVTARAAKLLRAHHDLRDAKVHELSLPRIVQAFIEALIAAWDTDQGMIGLSLPGKMSAGGIPVEMPGGGNAVKLSIAAKRNGRTWDHACALGEHHSEAAIRAWMAKYGNAYEAAQLWSEPAVYAAFRQFFHLENKQFLAITVRAGSGQPVMAAAQAGLAWEAVQSQPDPTAAYEKATRDRHAAFQVPAARAKTVAAQAARLPRTAWPDVVPLSVIRMRGDALPIEAIVHHLTDVVGMSLEDAGQALGLSKSTVNTHLRRMKGLDKPAASLSRETRRKIGQSNGKETTTT
jgi:predicted DNA-binding protein (UPF0251 family)